MGMKIRIIARCVAVQVHVFTVVAFKSILHLLLVVKVACHSSLVENLCLNLNKIPIIDAQCA